jgi:beta-lactamase regulating signal transducer with metallopeptidase domain
MIPMIKVTLVVLAGLGVARLLRSQSAALRHWVLWTALACAAAAPAVQLIVPGWSLWPAGASAAAPAPQPRATVTVQQTFQQTAAASHGQPPQRSASSSPSASVSWLWPIWITGTAISFGMLLIGFGRLAWLASRSEPIRHGAWRDVADDVARQYGLRTPVVLLQTDHPTLLVTWGMLRPKIILPAAAREWTADRMRVVLCHELAHIRRGDWAAQMTAELLRSIYWFNPLMWIASTRLRRESEQACDDEVLNLGIDGPEYAGHLLDLARAARKHRRSLLPDVPAPAMLRPSSLERRVSAMLNTRLNRHAATRPARIATLAGLLGLTMLIAGFGAAAQSFATLSGSVVDPMNSVISGVTLTLTSARTQAKHEVSSDANGRFEFVGLPAGEYALEARFPAFKAFRTDVTVGAQDVQRNVALQIGSLTETIMVSVSASEPLTASADFKPAREALPKRSLASCKAASTGGNIVPPRKLKDVHPEYPRHLRASGPVAGVVVMDARIGQDGLVRDIKVLGPAQPDLAKAAMDAVWQWEFDSTLLNCVPVEVAMTVTVTFTVEK